MALVLCHGLGLVSPASSAGQLRRVTLDEAVELFNQNNLELQISRAATAELAGVVRQARAFPNPVASVTHESISREDLSSSETYYTLTQPIDWPWRYRNRRRAGSDQVAAAVAELRADSARLLFDLKRVYVEAAAAEEALEVVERVTAVFRRADESGSARFEEGDISGFELKRLRVERARYEQLRLEADLEVARRRRRLTLLTVPADGGIQLAPVSPPRGDPPSVTGVPLVRQALGRRGEVTAAVASLGAMRAAASVTKWGRLPDPAITGGYKRQSDGLAGAFLGLALPLPLWDRKGGDVAAAAARVEAAERREQMVRVQVTSDVRTAAENYASLEASTALIRDQLFSDVDDLLDVALVSYAEGELTLLELLDAAEAFREMALTVSRLEADSWIAYYDLERAVGGFVQLDGRGQDDR